MARGQGMTHDLVCAGPYGWSSRDLAAAIDRLGIRPCVHFIGYVPVDDLPVIYNLAELFIFPSLYEGFGLPVVEAMACGTPVITSNTSSLGEIAGGAAETIDPYSTEAMADALVRLARDEELRHERAAQGLDRARTFSWRRTAREMLALYSQAAGLTSAQPQLQNAPGHLDADIEPAIAATPVSAEANALARSIPEGWR
jgi:glycosyltransferase involved in cell wall biosynthesis